MTMNQPLGRLVALQFRNVAAQPGQAPTVPVLRVHLRAPDGDYHHHDLMNDDWLISNEALQFLALWGYKPSEIGREDTTMRNCMPDTTCVPITTTDAQWHEDASWGLAQAAMEGGKDALREADWFNGDDSTKGCDDSIGGGGGPDPGTGNRGGVEGPSDPEKGKSYNVE